jgi:hypothetical protein
MKFNDKIPESIRKQLGAYEKTLFVSETTLAVGAALSALVASLLLFFGTDRLFDTPTLARIAILAAGLIPAAILAFRWAKAWILRRRGVRELAAAAQARHRELGDRLLGAVELAETGGSEAGISDELLEAAIARIAEKTKNINFKKDVEFKKPALAALGAVALAIAAITMMSLFPDAFSNALKRWLNPLKALARYTFTIIDEPSSDIVAPRNEPFEVECVLNPESKWLPDSVAYSLPGAGAGQTEVDNRSALIKFQGLDEPSNLTIRAGDASISKKVIPLRRPFPKGTIATIIPPKYTARAPFSMKLEGGAVSALQGSKLSIALEMNRALASAKLLFPGTEKQPINPKLDGAAVEYPETTVEKNFVYRLECEDKHGLKPKTSYDIQIDAVRDSEPYVELPSLAPFSAMLRDEVLMVEIKVEDDYGVEKLDGTYRIRSVDGRKTPLSPEKRMTLARGSKTKTNIDGAFAFSPEALGIPEKALVMIRGAAKDYFPGRAETFSAPKGIYIISQEEHAELLSRQLGDLMAELEDMARRERNSLRENNDIEKMPDEKLTKQGATDKIDSQHDRERGEKREAQRLAQKMAKLMKEALRNKKIPDKVLAEWAKLMDKLNSISKNEMKNMVSKLSKASSSSNAKKRRDEMKKAIAEQKKLLEKLKKMVSKMDDSLKNMAMENFVNRLKKAAGTERGIAAETRKMMKDIIGLPPNRIPPKIKTKFEAQKKRQKDLGEEGRSLHEEIDAFFARTRIEKYKEVADDMKKTKLEEKLRKTEKTLEDNRSAAAIAQTENLAKNFLKWADILSKKGNQKAPNGQNGKNAKIDMELLMSLLRIIQGEQNLRKKTRSLEKNKAANKEYKRNATQLAGKQQELRKLLDKAKQRAAKTCPKAQQLLGAVGNAMDDAEKLLSIPKTNTPTVAAETAVIELLAGAAKQAGKGGGQGSGLGAMMALLRMMMGQSSGASGGGSAAGGFTDRRNMNFNTPNYNREEGEKGVDGTSGKTRRLPEEYKTAIEAFFKKVKKSGGETPGQPNK